MKIATITFHGAHNYGSVLQAYALQTFIKDMFQEAEVDCEYKIINYRSEFQKEAYGIIRPKSPKRKVKRLLQTPFKKKIEAQKTKFELFLSSELCLTQEFSTEDSLQEIRNSYDVYISGSDQIWNIRPGDFSFAYLLEFTDRKKISYAVSLGPKFIDWEKYNRTKYETLLNKYSSISVREDNSKKMIDDLVKDKECFVHVDPTLLLSVDKWREIESDYADGFGDYILYYCLEQSRDMIQIAKEFSKKLGLRVIIPTSRSIFDYTNHFDKCFDAGPKDFLSLIDHAAFVLTSSFHGTVFSLIYEKAFCVVNGMSDNRISNILKKTGMEGCALEKDADIHDYKIVKRKEHDIDDYMEIERKHSNEYLATSLGLRR